MDLLQRHLEDLVGGILADLGRHGAAVLALLDPIARDREVLDNLAADRPLVRRQPVPLPPGREGRRELLRQDLVDGGRRRRLGLVPALRAGSPAGRGAGRGASRQPVVDASPVGGVAEHVVQFECLHGPAAVDEMELGLEGLAHAPGEAEVVAVQALEPQEGHQAGEQEGMVHRHAQLDVAEVAGAVQVGEAARDAGPAARVDGAEPGVVNAAGEGRADGVVGLGGGDLHHGAVPRLGVGVDAELDAFQLRPDDGVGEISLGPAARTRVEEAHHISSDLT